MRSVYQNWDTNRCTRGSRGFAPSKLLPAVEAQLSISECPAIGAGLKLVTNKVGHDPGVLCKPLYFNLEQAFQLTELTHSKCYLMWDKKSYILQATTQLMAI